MKSLVGALLIFFCGPLGQAGSRILSPDEWPAFLVFCLRFKGSDVPVVDCAMIDQIVGDLRIVANAELEDEGGLNRALQAFFSALSRATTLTMKEGLRYRMAVGGLDIEEKMKKAAVQGDVFLDLSPEMANLAKSIVRDPASREMKAKIDVLMAAIAASMTLREIDRLAAALPRLGLGAIQEYGRPESTCSRLFKLQTSDLPSLGMAQLLIPQLPGVRRHYEPAIRTFQHSQLP